MSIFSLKYWQQNNDNYIPVSEGLYLLVYGLFRIFRGSLPYLAGRPCEWANHKTRDLGEENLYKCIWIGETLEFAKDILNLFRQARGI
jgi:hypothetical protein